MLEFEYLLSFFVRKITFLEFYTNAELYKDIEHYANRSSINAHFHGI